MLAWKEESHGNTSLLIEANVVWGLRVDIVEGRAIQQGI